MGARRKSKGAILQTRKQMDSYGNKIMGKIKRWKGVSGPKTALRVKRFKGL